MCSLNSHKQSQGKFLPNEIDDDMAASAASLEVSTSLALRSFNQAASFLLDSRSKNDTPLQQSTAKENEKKPSFILDSSQKNDLENSILFKKKARPKCIRNRVVGAVLADKTNVTPTNVKSGQTQSD